MKAGREPIVGLFPGQGSEQPGMLEQAAGLPGAREVIGRIESALGQTLLVTGHHTSLSERSLHLHLSLYAVSACYWRVLRERYVLEAVAGHSLGFYGALAAAGSLSLEDGARVIVAAHRAIEELSQGGRWAMGVIIGLGVPECERICDKSGDVHVSNVNSATQITLSGREQSVAAALTRAHATGALDARVLDIPYPLHSPFLKGVGDILGPAVSGIRLREPGVPVFDHTTGHPLNAVGIRHVLIHQLERRVQWRDTLESLGAEGHGRFLEVGPGDVLSKLARWVLRDAHVVPAQEALCPAGEAGPR